VTAAGYLGGGLSPDSPQATVPYRRLILRLAARYALHPLRAARAVRAGWRFRARGWSHRPPFLPLPPLEYIEWRLHTAYGRGALPEPPEVERYLRWVDRMRREVAGRG
jgi:hypothetical protein